jgi:bifunctional non-homologous end joining protein LigD
LLAVNGENLTAMALEDRKRRLAMLIGESDAGIRYTPHFVAEGAEVLKHACRLGAEGIVSKCRDAPYRAGQRSYDWQKSKCVKRQDFVVGGFTEPERSRVGIGALLLGYYENDPIRGKGGTGKGWTDSFGRSMRTQLETIEMGASPFRPGPPRSLSKNAHWVEPLIVAEVQFSEWTEEGGIRHPSLQGFRVDKRPTDVKREHDK